MKVIGYKVQCRKCGNEFTFKKDLKFQFCEECGDLEFSILDEIYKNE